MDNVLKEELDGSYSFVTSNLSLLGVLLFGPLALALLGYIWAFCSQRHKLPKFREFLVLSLKRRHKDLHGAQNVYYSAFALLLFDGFTIITGLVWGILVFCQNSGLVCLIFCVMWFGFRLCSVFQHLITALISVLFVSRPKYAQGLRTLSEVLDVVPFILVILGFRISEHIFIGVDIYNLLVMVAIVVSCCISATSPMAQQRKPIGLLAAIMFVTVVLPNAIINILMLTSDDYHPQAFDILLFTNFYIAMDAVLFYLVLKIDEDDQSDTQYECAIRSV